MLNQTILKVLHDAGQYFHTYSGSTFVVLLDQVSKAQTSSIAKDIALLCALNIKIILIAPSHPIGQPFVIRSDEELEQLLVKTQVTQRKAEVLLNQAFYQYQINSAIVSSSAVTTKPYGIHNGIDYGYFGKARNIKKELLNHILESASCLIIPTFGFAPTGETFIMDGLEMAEKIASSLQCQKLMILTEHDKLPREMNATQAKVLSQDDNLPIHIRSLIKNSIPAIEHGVERIHLLNKATEGELIIELLTRDGIGSMITNEPYDEIKPAELTDIQALKALMQPLEDDGTLKKRSIQELEKDIHNFYLMFRDNSLIGAVAYYPYPEEKTAELASLIVHPDYRKGKKANQLMQFVEHKAHENGFDSIFLLTTQTAHWFMGNGFKEAKISDLPKDKLAVYDYTRNSKVFFKHIV
ncbi:amino-acid N-acetyltransferase [Wohlfahrtiimonas larvae]|uniref:Amino-acid acetyltransferase n=1 Tax=Wohlfahrtiimonas larvae TaxID=1157986 RepID=A0ABP9MWP6_9GAMM|nr:amino-acid N-acetyltransferase [Wohlfahrtiimonas larvae]